jgi:N-acetylmuramoyl-L-alanine amidase
MKKSILSFITVAAITVGITGNASAEEVKVEKGDTLSDIAEQNNVSVEELIEWNNLSGEIIHPEDKLTIQEYYEIIKGDSLWDIAKKNNVSVDDLQKWNEIDTHIIHPGDELIINSNSNKNKDVQKVEESPKQKIASEVEKAPATTAKNPIEKSNKSDEKEITVEATAYTADCEGCSGTTSTGIDLKANPNQKVIAVDPNVIPLGSKVHVEGYGEAIAGDIGGAIKGKKIDVFIPSKSDAKQWGRKDVQVKILN